MKKKHHHPQGECPSSGTIEDFKLAITHAILSRKGITFTLTRADELPTAINIGTDAGDCTANGLRLRFYPHAREAHEDAIEDPFFTSEDEIQGEYTTDTAHDFSDEHKKLAARLYAREYQLKHHKEIQAKRREYHQKNKARIIANVMKWRAANLERHKSNIRKYAIKHKERIAAYKKAYYAKNREKLLVYYREYNRAARKRKKTM